MIAIFRRELRSFFQSPVGYAYLAIYLVIANTIFYLTNVAIRTSDYSSTATAMADTTSYFGVIRYILIITTPILAMKLFPEERKNKTDQILMTAPVSITGMVMGKFLAAYVVYVIGLVPTLFNMFFIASKAAGDFEGATVLGNYVGLLFIGAAFLAVATLMSVLTENMITAFILGAFSLAFFAFIDFLEVTLNNKIVTAVVDAISITQRFSEFNQGLFNIASLVYFLSIAVIFIFLTIRVIDKRRWS